MDKKIEMAIDDLTLIKRVIQRTRQDFSRISAYFIGIGLLNLAMWLSEETAYMILNLFGYGHPAARVFWWGGRVLLLVGYLLLFVYYYQKVKKTGNEICEGMVKIWMIVLIGIRILGWLYIRLLPSGNDDKITVLWRCQELIEVLPVLFALFMTGILTKRTLITAITAFYSIFYFVLFVSMKEVSYGTWGGVGTRISASRVCIQYLMSLGMILLGIYLWRRREGRLKETDRG
ncbi:MAG: hypothetical protein K2P48_12830 [Lachnospiraceae bacterium]|nr:hypothetical protein [Lachnospiraceae bacterium]